MTNECLMQSVQCFNKYYNTIEFDTRDIKMRKYVTLYGDKNSESKG